MNKNIVILIVGHTKSHKGACNSKIKNLNEFDINSKLVDKISEKLENNGINTIIIKDLSISDKIKTINSINYMDKFGFKPKNIIQVSMHFNAFKGYISNTSGCEVLISNKKLNSAKLAGFLMEEFSNLGNIYRGIKILNKKSRGYSILTNTNSNYSVLCEPLFIDSEEGELLLDEGILDFLINSYYNGIIRFIKEL